MRRIARPGLGLALAALLAGGCQGPSVPVATRPERAPRPTGLERTPFHRSAQALLPLEGRPPRGGGVAVSDAMIARVERAVRLRQRAYAPSAADVGMAARARSMAPPSKNGDGGGICIDLRSVGRALTTSGRGARSRWRPAR